MSADCINDMPESSQADFELRQKVDNGKWKLSQKFS